MPKEYSPFTPGVPVPVDFFVGRKKEIEQLRFSVNQVVHGRQQNVFMMGERGIGKSSLAAFFRNLPEIKDVFVSVHTLLGGVSTLEEMVKRIYDGLLKDSLVDKPLHEKIRNLFGKYVKKIGLFDISIEFAPPEGELKSLARIPNFIASLEKLIKEISDSKKGLLIALDDINGLSANVDFANWYKSLVDEIATSQKTVPVLFMLIGLPDRRDSLISLNPSISRIFSIIEIKPLSMDETKDFYCKTFNKYGITTAPEALDIMCRLSGGLPMLVHEIGDAVFRIDTDDHIELDDATEGIFAAADIVGRKYLDPIVYSAIRSENYRSILFKLADRPFKSEFRKKDVESTLTEKEKRVFHNFLRRMVQLGVIVRELGLGPGGYRYANQLYSIYMLLVGGRRKRKKS